MPSGNFLSEMADLAQATGPLYTRDPSELILEGIRHDYTFSEMCYGSENKKMVRGGTEIRSAILFQGNGTWEKYKPGAPHTWKNPQLAVYARSPYRYAMAHMSWLDQEIMHNDAIRNGNRRRRFEQYFNLYEEKDAAMWVSVWEGLEDDYWKAPDYNSMEDPDGIDTYSIWAIINEETNGLFGTAIGDPWTTVMNLSPTAPKVAGRWAPQQETYSSATVNTTDNIVGGLDNLWHACKFNKPRKFNEYWEDPGLRQQKITTSKSGVVHFSELLRAGQDHFVAGNQDPAYPDPQFRGIPVVRAEGMETSPVYINTGATAYTTELAAANKGPRFMMKNYRFLYPVFFEDRFFFRDKASRHHNVPDTWVIPMALWYNLHCNSRQRQGILSPSGSVYTT